MVMVSRPSLRASRANTRSRSGWLRALAGADASSWVTVNATRVPTLGELRHDVGGMQITLALRQTSLIVEILPVPAAITGAVTVQLSGVHLALLD